jgi:hypothetical protein
MYYNRERAMKTLKCSLLALPGFVLGPLIE